MRKIFGIYNSMRIHFDSKNEAHKKPFGCIRQNEICELTVHIPKSCETKNVWLKVEGESGFCLRLPLFFKKEENGYNYFSVSFSLFKTGLYFYYFTVETQNEKFSLYKLDDTTNMESGDKWQLTCFDKDYDTPNEYKGAVIYQIFPDRFNKSGENDLAGKLVPYIIHKDVGETPCYLPDKNGRILNNDFYGGNLRGITEKLDYIKELGADVIYLNPIFFAYSNHRYDTADYKKIDPMLGTERDFQLLCDESHKQGMKIILDGVFSHTGSNSIYFDKNNIFGNGAFHNRDSPYKEWFLFTEYPYKYTSWWGIDTLPSVNELNSSYMDFIINDEDSVVAHWLKQGADGFRLDVVDELPDEFIMALKKRVKEINKDAIIIGEVWEDASNKESYGIRRKYFANSELDSVMNYPFRKAIIDYVTGRGTGFELCRTVMTICENYPKPVTDCLMNSLSTHDTVRILTSLDNSFVGSKEQKANFLLEGEKLKSAIEKEKLAVFLQFVLPGSPTIYYGDEAGLQGFEDPFNRRFFPWDNINQELLYHYKNLARLKKRYESLKTGNIKTLYCDYNVYCFERTSGNETVYAAVNTGDIPYEIFGEVIFGSNVIGKNGYVLYTR